MIQLVRVAYAGLLLWQPTWHWLLPQPHGSRNWILALAAALPLLPFLHGVLKTRRRSQLFAAFVVMVYFMIGVMEAWSNPAQRYAAVVQIVLSCAYFAGVVFSASEK